MRATTLLVTMAVLLCTAFAEVECAEDEASNPCAGDTNCVVIRAPRWVTRVNKIHRTRKIFKDRVVHKKRFVDQIRYRDKVRRRTKLKRVKRGRSYHRKRLAKLMARHGVSGFKDCARLYRLERRKAPTKPTLPVECIRIALRRVRDKYPGDARYTKCINTLASVKPASMLLQLNSGEKDQHPQYRGQQHRRDDTEESLAATAARVGESHMDQRFVTQWINRYRTVNRVVWKNKIVYRPRIVHRNVPRFVYRTRYRDVVVVRKVDAPVTADEITADRAHLRRCAAAAERRRRALRAAERARQDAERRRLASLERRRRARERRLATAMLARIEAMRATEARWKREERRRRREALRRALRRPRRPRRIEVRRPVRVVRHTSSHSTSAASATNANVNVNLPEAGVDAELRRVVRDTTRGVIEDYFNAKEE